MLPLTWKNPQSDSNVNDPHLTNDGVRYANSILYHVGDKIVECTLPTAELDKLELFDLPQNHFAYNKHCSTRGVRAKEQIPPDTVVGFYAGIYRPGLFSSENPYVFTVHPQKLDLVIDASKIGNITRYINDPRGSGKEANLEAEDMPIQSKSHSIRCVQFRTTKPIEANEELLYTYEASTTGYWDTFQTKDKNNIEVVDLTTILPDTIPIKRESINPNNTIVKLEGNSVRLESSLIESGIEPVMKRTKLMMYSKMDLMVDPTRIKTLVNYSNMKLIRLSSSWKVCLRLSEDFNDVDPSDVVMSFKRFDTVLGEFISVVSDSHRMFLGRSLKDGRVTMTIRADTNSRITPFPRTSLQLDSTPLSLFKFVATYENLEAESDVACIVGSRNSDFDESRWDTDRQQSIRNTLE